MRRWVHLNFKALEKQRIAILASGSRTNAEEIIRYFASSESAEVVWVGCNRPESEAGVYERTKTLGLETASFQAAQLKNGEVFEMLKVARVDWVILAGFLLRVPVEMVHHFQGKMVNIHPALLPQFGGKGMYGMNVHRAVKAAGAGETGMTVNWVNAAYDEGDIIFQASCSLSPEDDVDRIASKVAQLEHQYYARTVDALIQDALTRKP